MAFWSKKSDDGKTAGAKAETARANGAASQSAGPTYASAALQFAAGARVSGESTPDGAAHIPSGHGLSGQLSSIAQAAAQAQEELSATELQKRAAASKMQLMSFGEIVSVLMRSQQFRALSLADVEALVVPAVMTGQFLVAEAQSKANGSVVPVAMALWASVSEDVDRRLSQNLDQPFRLAANEWKGGHIAWLVAVAGDQRLINPMLKKLQDTTLQGRPLKIRAKGKDGKEIVGTFTPSTAEPVPGAS